MSLATWKDLRRLAAIGLGYLATSIWPRRWDPWIVGRLAGLFYRFDGGRVRRLAALMERVLGPAAAGSDLVETARRHYHMRMEDGWGRLRDLHRPGWTPAIEVEGLEHLRQGLAGGRGVILWGMLFCGSTLPKAVLWRAGVRLTHLSRADHGAPSRSWVGLRVAAPLYCRAENRYLERRIILPLEGSPGSLRELVRLLEANACVSMVGEASGRHTVAAQLFGREVQFATGAPALAWKQGCALLTLSVAREGPRRYRLLIEASIEPDRNSGRDAFILSAIRQFAERLEDHIARRPADWQGWHLADRLPAGSAG